MLISSKGQYALRLMVDISINSGSTVTVKAVARRCGYIFSAKGRIFKERERTEGRLPSEHAGGGDHGWDGAKGD